MLRSLFAFTKRDDLEVFVVDNASGDDLSFLSRDFTKVRLLYSETNLGFAGGCNLALKESKGDYVILINPDVEFTEDAVSKIVARMEQDREVGVGGIALKNMNGTQQSCVWSFPRPADQLLLLLKLNHFFPNLAPLRRWLMKDFDYSKTAD